MGILNIQKKDEILKTIHSYTKEDLLEWVDMDTKRMASAEQEDNLSQPHVGKLNGASRITAKSKGVSIKKAVRAKTSRQRTVRVTEVV